MEQRAETRTAPHPPGVLSPAAAYSVRVRSYEWLRLRTGETCGLVGALVLLGWALGLMRLLDLHDGWPTMKANSALGFVLLGLFLRFAALPEESVSRQRMRIALSVALVSLACVTVFEYLLDLDFGIDQILVEDARTAAADAPGRMSLATALAFLLMGSSHVALTARRLWLSQGLALLAGIVGLICVAGYMYDVDALVRVPTYSSMALHTAVLFVLGSLGTLCTHPNRALMATFTAESAGGLTARYLLPFAVGVPFALGWIVLAGVRSGYFEAGFAAAVLMVSTVLVLCTVTYFFARRLTPIDLELRRGQEELRIAEQKYRGIIEHATEGIFQCTSAGKLVTANLALARILGYATIEEAVANVENLWARLMEDDVEQVECMERLAETGVIASHEVCTQGTGDSQRWLLLNLRQLHDTQGGVTYLEGSVLDISARKQLEEQLRQSQKMEAIGMLAGGVAHDLNNHLTAILGFSELLLEDLSPATTHGEHVSQIRRAGQRSAQVTRQLLAFSRRQILSPRVVNLNELVEELREMLKRLIGENIRVEYRLAQDLGNVRVDCGHFEQVLLNLALNARDAMRYGGVLVIETVNAALESPTRTVELELPAGQYVAVKVSDTGSGMDNKTMARAFEPFFTTKPRGQGTGLGLSTVYGIVRQSGGGLWVYSEPGEGTTVKVYLPRVDEPVCEEPSLRRSEPRRAEGEVILFVEDDDFVRSFGGIVLRRLGFTVHVAATPEEALQLTQDSEFSVDLLITDVILPGMNGRELAERLVPRFPNLGVLYVSGYTENVIAHHGIAKPGIHFLEKPLFADALREKVHEILGQRQRTGE